MRCTREHNAARRSIDQTTSRVGPFLFSCFLVESHVCARIYVSSYKRWASFPSFRLPRTPSDPVSSVQPELLPAFLMSDRKRAACVIYARDFSPVAPAAPCSCAHCTYRCRTDHVVSRLYRRVVLISLYRPRHSGRKKTYDWRKSTYVYRGQGTRMVPRQCYLRSDTMRAAIRISCITCARDPQERIPFKPPRLLTLLITDENNSKL